MTSRQTPDRRRILSDPLILFKEIHPDGGRQQVARLTALWQRHLQLDSQLKATKENTRILSSRIGAAKRAGENLDGLRSEMQEASARLKEISAQLAETSNSILACFDTPGTQEHNDGEQLTPDTHPYPDKAAPGDNISIALLDNDHAEWNSYVASNPAASIYHRAEWLDLIHDTFGHKGHYFLARGSDNAVAGILPLIQLRSRLFGNFMVSMPYFNYGGAIADHPAIEHQLMQAAARHAMQLGVTHIEYRDDIPREGMPVRDTKVNMVLPLPADPDDLWNSFTPKLRAQIRRPQREHPDVRTGGREYLDDFYRVFARNMRDLGTPVYGKAFFRNILLAFPEQSNIVVVYLQNRPVAAGFLLGHRDTLEIPWASALKEVNQLSMNMLLYWSVLRLAIERQYRYFDFGRSSRDSGTFRFKQQWGAKPRQLFWNYWLRGNGRLPALNPDNPRYALAINLWRRLPLSVTTWLGPSIVKNLP